MPDINLRVQVEGVDALLRGFQRVFTNLTPLMVDLEKRVAEKLQHYPPPPPNSTYERTGDLGRAWAVSADARGTNLYQDRVSVEMKNDMAYAGWVQGVGTQTQQHQRTGWQTTQQVLDAETPLFLEDLASAIEHGWAT
jgi:hypothetical protein